MTRDALETDLEFLNQLNLVVERVEVLVELLIDAALPGEESYTRRSTLKTF